MRVLDGDLYRVRSVIVELLGLRVRPRASVWMTRANLGLGVALFFFFAESSESDWVKDYLDIEKRRDILIRAVRECLADISMEDDHAEEC